jgi:hypothetical protein
LTRRAPSKVAPSPDIAELRSAALAFCFDARAAAAVALTFQVSGLQRQVLARILTRTADFLTDNPTAGDHDQAEAE